MPHHRECWQLNGRCTTYGCAGSPARAIPSPDTTTQTGNAWGPLRHPRGGFLSRSLRLYRASLWLVPTFLAWLVLWLVVVMLTNWQAVRPMLAPLPTPQADTRPPGYSPLWPPPVPQWRTVNRQCDLQDFPADVAPAIATLRPGERVEILREHGAWLYVRLGDEQRGYLRRSALKNSGASATPLAPPRGGPR